MHIWEGKYDLGGGKILDLQGRGLKLPLAMGHEVVGKVAKLGPDAKGVSVGDEMIVSRVNGVARLLRVSGGASAGWGRAWR